MVRGVLGSPLSVPVVLGPLPFGFPPGSPPLSFPFPGPVLGFPPPGLFPEPAKLGILVSPALSLDLQPMPTIPNRAAQATALMYNSPRIDLTPCSFQPSLGWMIANDRGFSCPMPAVMHCRQRLGGFSPVLWARQQLPTASYSHPCE